MNYIDIAALPKEHVLRNTKLRDINAEARNTNAGDKAEWRPVARWKIGTATFNELGVVWLANNDWRTPI